MAKTKIEKISKITDEKFLNLYILEGKKKTGDPLHYQLASRAKKIEELKAKSKREDPDAVIIYALYAGEEIPAEGTSDDSGKQALPADLNPEALKVLMIRQYRPSIDRSEERRVGKECRSRW